MVEFLIGLLILIAVVALALVGFVRIVVWIFRLADEKRDRPPASPQPTISGDVRASRRLIDYLVSERKISSKVHAQLSDFLDKNFSELPDAANTRRRDLKPHRRSSPATETSPAKELLADSRSVSTDTSSPTSVDPSNVDPNPAAPVATRASETDSSKPIVNARLVQPEHGSASRAESIPVDKSPEVRSEPRPGAKPAPWDLPDPPSPVPRRSFGELMSGFMQEKNMRWGELTSGILIVLSAVGLVVSLQEELQDTIPYFSALIFMLMTAAIHGAGIYTLKKWKLRNTSRGTLIIGLLLVPLNFVAACVLSDRRSINDPWLWIAVITGISSFTVMTWWSSKHLLRRGNLPMTAAIIGCGMGALLINRTVDGLDSSLLILLLALPVAVSFLIGTCAIDSRQWVRQSWSSRASVRLFLFLGVSTFAAISALSLAPVSSENSVFGLVAIMPIAAMMCIVISCLGSIVFQGVRAPISHHLDDQDDDTSAARMPGIQMGGLVIKILGLVLLAIVLVVSASNPIVFVVCSLISTVGLIALSIHQRDAWLVPIAWVLLSAGALLGINVATGSLGFDQWTSTQELLAALINGKSALCLLLVGLAVGAANQGLNNWCLRTHQPPGFIRQGWMTGGAISGFGCGIALLASLIYPDHVFDVMVASGLLMLAAVGLLAACVVSNQKRSRWSQWLPNSAAMLLLLALAHGMIWNPTISEWLDSLDTRVQAIWLVLFAIHGTVLVVLGWWLSRRSKAEEGETSFVLVAWGVASSLIVTVGALTLVPSQTGWATGLELVASVNWFLAGVVWHRADLRFKQFASTPFVLATGVLACVAVAELVSRWQACPDISSAQHWLVQLAVISVWSVVWIALSRWLKNTKLSWVDSQVGDVDQWILYGLALAMAVFVGDVLIAGAAQELVQSWDAAPLFRVAESSGWMSFVLAAIWTATMVSLISKPLPWKAVSMMAVWFLSWSFGAAGFAGSHSVASAMRWLVPIGGLAIAIVIACRRPVVPAWSGLRNALTFSGKSFWEPAWTQRLINLALSIATIVVLLISTLTVSQVLLHGAGALGGPAPGSWFHWISPEVSFGTPVALIVATFLLYAISEQRTWLAALGSAVFQYVVLLAVVLLFLSPHPKLASSWFINILTAVSLGMTGYGFLWFWMYERINGGAKTGPGDEAGVVQPPRRIGQLEMHTLLNGLLISSLAVLAIGRYYLVPDRPGAWISSVGSPLAVLAWAAFGVLLFCIGRKQASRRYSLEAQVWLIGWMGMMLVGLVAAVLDRQFSEAFVGWLPFRSVMVGALVVSLMQVGWIVYCRALGPVVLGSGNELSSWGGTSSLLRLTLPVLMAGGIVLMFATRGALNHPAAFWLYLVVIVVWILVPMFLGWVLEEGLLGLVAAAVAILGVSLLVRQDPQGWFSNNRPDWFNLVAIVLSLLAFCWLAASRYSLDRRRKQPSESITLMWLPNAVLWAGTVWILLASLLEFVMGSGRRTIGSSLSNPLGVVAFAAVAGVSLTTLWSSRVRLRVLSWCLLSISLAIALASVIGDTNPWRVLGATEGMALIVAVWGIGWLNRERLFGFASRLGPFNSGLLEHSLRRQLPIYSLVFGGIVLLLAWIMIFQFEIRPQRYLAASVPFLLAIGLGAQSNPSSRRWLQQASLILLTVGVLFLAWADLSKAHMNTYPMVRVMVRSLIVLSAAMFVYGGLVTRWVREGDTWLKTLREMAVVTCGLAVVCLVLVVAGESVTFVENVGSGLKVGESVIIAILVASMIAGLIMIAVRPKNDPFALSLRGRMGYVYAAEFVAMALAAHLYYSMPWLFQLGIMDYWPYILMAICFGGVGIAHVLEKRQLTVLGQPLFHTAAVLPLLVAIAIFFGIDSLANRELVMMTAGMVYLMIGVTHRSPLGGVAAIVFGTAAMWMFFQKHDFSFVHHPQLWLIPPAVSTLIAGQICAQTISTKQLSALRYICITVIYVSSTMEVFISGIGEQLWPPVVLAVLAVAGIMAGIMFRVKSFLYFGSLFLLMAMVTMVAHAHQRLNHVWPWWAFGIGLGIAILVMFGLFEKRKNEMKTIAAQLKEWDT